MLLYVYLLWYLNIQFEKCNAESITYMDLERPTLFFLNESVFKSINVTSRRVSRNDPRHYSNIYAESVVTINNTLKCDLKFYEWLTNSYKPSFIEIHYGFCDFLERDQLLAGPIMRKYLNASCPVPPGVYRFTGLTIMFVPKNFPFTRGRLYVNLTMTTKSQTYSAAQGRVDVEVKTVVRKQTTKG